MKLLNHIAFSVKNPIKEHCGDASFSGEIVFNNENINLLLVADGVSKANKDWLASNIWILIKFFIQNKK